MSDNRIDTGGPAYPEHHYFDPERGQHGQHVTASDIGCGGMTLLDYFAGQALAGAMASSPDGCTNFPFNADDGDDPPTAIVAGCCYELAAAMLAEKRRREGGDAP